MKYLELLAPAKNIEIGIAAIDCGADAVYIAGPAFGARQAAGNSIDDIARLCEYAHKFGVRIFLTVNTILYDNELEEAYRTMCRAEDAGVDAFIVQDLAVLKMADGGPDGNGRRIRLPLHASTQCAIREPHKALFYKDLGFSRLVLERELPLSEVEAISKATGCEIEFFVHGALCVCYSGQCYMSEHIAGRSANRGECIQACRSRYDLLDKSGHILVKNKSLLSLKDYNLICRLEDLAEVGVTSFKIEGRLKNISYVKNTVRAYSEAIDKLIASHPDKYSRASFGRVSNGFTPELEKTFNRGYTELFLDGKRGMWSSMDSAKGMGESIGMIRAIRPCGHNEMTIQVDFGKVRNKTTPVLLNGDGFASINSHGEVVGFRGDICSGNIIQCKSVQGLKAGSPLFRNISAEFEKKLDANSCRRLINIDTDVAISGSSETGFLITAKATAEDGRPISHSENAGNTVAENRDRMCALIESQFSKANNSCQFSLHKLDISTDKGDMPFASTAFLNSIRRTLAEKLEVVPISARPMLNLREGLCSSRVLTGTAIPHITASAYIDKTTCNPAEITDSVSIARYSHAEATNTTNSASADKNTGSPAEIQYGDIKENQFLPEHLDYSYNIANRLSREVYMAHGAKSADPAYEISHTVAAELMRTKYCVRHELGLCPKQGKVQKSEPLFLRNNGQVFVLKFDCGRCEMTVTSEEKRK